MTTSNEPSPAPDLSLRTLLKTIPLCIRLTSQNSLALSSGQACKACMNSPTCCTPCLVSQSPSARQFRPKSADTICPRASPRRRPACTRLGLANLKPLLMNRRIRGSYLQWCERRLWFNYGREKTSGFNSEDPFDTDGDNCKRGCNGGRTSISGGTC